MRRRVRKGLRLAAWAGLWLFILYLGINIIAKGSSIIYGEAFEKIISDTLEEAGKKLGAVIIKRSGIVFSYLYEDEDDKDSALRFIENMYLWRADIYDKNIVYPAEDRIYDELLAKQVIESMFAKSTLLENEIPVISYLPDYAYQATAAGEGDRDESFKERKKGVLCLKMRRMGRRRYLCQSL